MRTVLALATLMALAAPTDATKPQPPLDVNFATAPAATVLHPGDVGMTVITVSPRLDADTLEIHVAPFAGVELLSKQTEMTFANLKRGERGAIAATVKLTGERFGTLSVTYSMTSHGRIDGGATMIVYGSP